MGGLTLDLRAEWHQTPFQYHFLPVEANTADRDGTIPRPTAFRPWEKNMISPALENEANCSGPSYDDRGALSPECRACGKCDAVARLMRYIAPAAQMNNETMRRAGQPAR
jgi:hypothetical protein